MLVSEIQSGCKIADLGVQIFSTVVLLGTEGAFVNNIKIVGEFVDDAQRFGWLVTVCGWI